MAKRKVGTITWSPDGSSCRVRVQRGRRSDGSPRVLTRTLHGASRDEAEAEAVRMAAELGASDLAGDSMTLSAFYYGVFRGSPSNRGTPRTKATLRGYDYAMEHYVLPELGDLPLRRVTHDRVAAVVNAARSPKNCKTVLRAVLLGAYDMGFLSERPFQRRIATPRPRREQQLPWNGSEVAAAMEAAKGWRPELVAYLALGLSGLRRSEALAVRPRDLSFTKIYDFASGEETESMTVRVCRTMTEADGLREATKNDHSARVVPVFSPMRQALAEAARACDPEDRIVGLSVGRFSKEWRRAIEESGLRVVPPSLLRHTSDTLRLTAGIAPDLADKMNGRSEHASTFNNYFRPDLAAMEAADRKVGETIM